ncbi:hypothetical protein WR52_30435 (plasmid) [Bacillus cereus]|uniref:ABC transporter permease n=1 Tax=Bacillus cereus TaxID=1396 RepID=UPI0007B6B055|nr:ABC transporter permease [Bacillus cereus]ANC23025.1 hypothetical protein WR52_30435 [Bacillus cereus]
MNFISLLSKDFIYFTDLKNKMYVFLLFFQPLTFLTLIYFISLNREGINIERYIFATAIISMWSYILYSSGSSLIVQHWNDTLNLIIASPTSLYTLLITKVINNSIISLISFFLTIIYSRTIFHFALEIKNIYYFIISLCSLLISLSVIGIILALIFVAYKNVFQMQNLILYPILIISGIFYPVSNFPVTIQILSYLLPMTWSIKNIYSALEVGYVQPFDLFISFFISFIYLLISYYVLKKIEKTIKINGTIGAL